MKLRKRTDGELADLVIEYTRKAARAIAVVHDVHREQRRREVAQEAFLELQSKERTPWPCAHCGAIFVTRAELEAHEAEENRQ